MGALRQSKHEVDEKEHCQIPHKKKEQHRHIQTIKG